MTEFLETLPDVIAGHVREIVFVIVLVAATLVALRVVARAVRWLAVKLQAPALSLRPLVVAGRGVVLLVALSSVVGRYFDVNLFALLGGVFALIGVGFVAVWSTLSNVLCTLLLLTVRPFRIGDDLEFPPDALRGRVVDLNLFFTTLEGADGRLVQVPNNFFFQRAVLRRRADVGVALGEQLVRVAPAALADRVAAAPAELHARG